MPRCLGAQQSNRVVRKGGGDGENVLLFVFLFSGTAAAALAEAPLGRREMFPVGPFESSRDSTEAVFPTRHR